MAPEGTSTWGAAAPTTAAPTPSPDGGGPAGGRPPGMTAVIGLLLGVILVGAGLLRLWSLGDVPQDPFYDAAVRSMTGSWHNFFFGAFEPGASVSIDKPPLDLWLQVASVKLAGFGPVSLKLPQALAGTAAVGLLFAALLPAFGRGAALAAAAALAVLPISVLTARSDTMDAVMMALTVLALALVLRAGLTGRLRWLYLAGVVLGLAFNVKLLEALIPVPALAVLAWLALPGTGRRRLLALAGAAGALVAVSLSWLVATLAFPASERPFAIGSTNGSAWNAAFVFNGYDRVTGSARASAGGGSPSGPDAVPSGAGHDAALDRLAIRSPSATRLFDRAGPLSGRRLGFLLLAALLLGLPALVACARSPGRTSQPGLAGAGDARRRVARACAWGLGLWLLGGLVLFSGMTRLHARYVEAFTPAVAAAAGIGLVWACRGASRRRGLLAVALAALSAYAWYLKGGASSAGWVTVGAGVAALAVGWFERRRPARAGVALALVAGLALPASASIAVVDQHYSDAGRAGFMRPSELEHLSAYLRAHRGGARYEVAVASATQAASLVVRDAQPVLVLTTYDGRVVTSADRLAALVGAGAVGYALLGARCHPGSARTLAQCSSPGRWIAVHGQDVSRAAGVRPGLLWRLSNR